MAQYILTGQKPADMEHFAYDRFVQGKEIRPRYASGLLGEGCILKSVVKIHAQ